MAFYLSQTQKAPQSSHSDPNREQPEFPINPWLLPTPLEESAASWSRLPYCGPLHHFTARSSERSRFLSGCSHGPLKNSPASCTLRNKTSGNHRPSCCMRGGKSVERLCPIFLLQLLIDGDRLGGGGFLSGATSSEWVQGEDCASISRFHTSTIPRWYKVAHSNSFPFPFLHEPSQYNYSGVLRHDKNSYHTSSYQFLRKR